MEFSPLSMEKNGMYRHLLGRGAGGVQDGHCKTLAGAAPELRIGRAWWPSAGMRGKARDLERQGLQAGV